MVGSWRYRTTGALGVAGLTAFAVGLVNNATTVTVASQLPILRRLPVNPPAGPEFTFELLLTVGVMLIAFLPLYKPRPRRILDIIAYAQKRVLVAVFALATIGYFDYSYKLPRLTVLLITPLLLIALPAWFVWIRRRPSPEDRRAIVVGDDAEVMLRVVREATVPIMGYLCPTGTIADEESVRPKAVADGGYELLGLEWLGGLSRIEDVLVEYDVDTVVLAFEEADRGEFFGALDACYEHGVAAKVHREYADSVLTSEDAVGPLVDVEVEPWDVQDYLAKRAFDVVFSVVGLVVLAPAMLAIAVAIKLDDGGSVLYQQERTAVFGETFDVYKFRSMVSEGESPTPVDDDGNDRITKIGRLLRRRHLDELPQLWSILKGDMSVVGPRAAWKSEELLIERDTEMWRKRWFVKPGLTGLAQINEVTSTRPSKKLHYDIEYMKNQSIVLDVKIVIRQLYAVLFHLR